MAEGGGERWRQWRTRLNGILAQLSQQVLVCGEAKSHCVNFTMRDLLGAWPAGRAADLVLLQDGTSPVGGCEDAADKFENDMRNAGVTIVKCAEFSPK